MMCAIWKARGMIAKAVGAVVNFFLLQSRYESGQ